MLTRQWYQGEVEKPYLLTKARAMVDASETIKKVSEVMGAKTEGEAQQAREEAARVYLKERVRMGDALPEVEVVWQGTMPRRLEKERMAVSIFVTCWLKDDLYVELMQGLRYERAKQYTALDLLMKYRRVKGAAK